MKKPVICLTFSIACLFANVEAQENILPGNGNVGIGTTNPNVPLDVRGKMSI